MGSINWRFRSPRKWRIESFTEMLKLPLFSEDAPASGPIWLSKQVKTRRWEKHLRGGSVAGIRVAAADGRLVAGSGEFVAVSNAQAVIVGERRAVGVVASGNVGHYRCFARSRQIFIDDDVLLLTVAFTSASGAPAAVLFIQTAVQICNKFRSIQKYVPTAQLKTSPTGGTLKRFRQQTKEIDNSRLVSSGTTSG